MEYPQTNELAEVANKIILTGLNKRFKKVKGLWTDKLHTVLWAYHTMPHSSTQERPYRLVFRADVVIPIELSEQSSRIITIVEESNEDARRAELDLVKEGKERARIKEEAIK